MQEIDFEADSFQDIVAKDARYSPRAYALLMDVMSHLGKDGSHISAADILDEFRETTLDQYGPMSLAVLAEWGVRRCEDVGEMMFNLVESHRVGKDDGDTPEGFAGGYDFEEAFLSPYAT